MNLAEFPLSFLRIQTFLYREGGYHKSQSIINFDLQSRSQIITGINL